MLRRTPLFIDGASVGTARIDRIRNPFDDSLASEVPIAGHEDLERAVRAASDARESFRALPAHRRAAIADDVSRALGEQKEELAQLITLESGKPIRYARAEVARATTTFSLAAAVARTQGGELLPGDVAPGGEGKLVLVRRVPRGVVAAIAPFNFPLNLVAHKLAPALAVGAPVVLKPPHQAPSAGLLLAELLHRHGVPPGGINALHAMPDVAEGLARDPRIAVLSFTGSDTVGFQLKSIAGKKQVLLELGGNAPCIVDETVELDAILPRIVESAWANAGQVCIKAQRLIVERSIYADFVERFVAATRTVVCGDPSRDDTMVGPLIEPRHVERVLGLVREAESAGARVLTGGTADRYVVSPTILVDVPEEARVCRDEVFGPVTVVEPFDGFDDALARANRTRFGLQAGVFTRDLGRVLTAFERLEYGGVIVNDPPSSRLDHYPYGGVKDSGVGREGVRYAADELTETRVLVARA
jgi:acyl-CoA reductase-like NAD-dependent aldehyde dehydrogenase